MIVSSEMLEAYIFFSPKEQMIEKRGKDADRNDQVVHQTA
jgi:hypothetical protein